MNPSTEFPRSFKTVTQYRQGKAKQTGQISPVDFSVDQSGNGAGAIQAALDLFDNESQISSPTTFVSPDTIQGDGSALAEFMNKAADIESVFEFQNMDTSHRASAEQIRDAELYAGSDHFDSAPLKEVPSAPSNAGRRMIALEHKVGAELKQNARLEPSNQKAFDPSMSTARIVDQAAVIKDPQEESHSGFSSFIERDEHGRVVRALFVGGENCRFQYDAQGELVELQYAGLTWTKDHEGWNARDRQTEYRIDARICILPDGCISIEKDDVVRTLKQSGTRIDQHKTGSRTESRKLKNVPSPYDLLAKAKPVTSIWLTPGSNSNSGERLVLRTPPHMDIIQGAQLKRINDEAKSMIPPIADVAPLLDTGNFPVLSIPNLEPAERPDRLRELEDQLAEAEHAAGSSLRTLKLDIAESYLKSCLWIIDRIKGQSSPMHLPFLDQLADIYFSRQRNDMAELTHLRALHIREKFHGVKQAELHVNISGLARIYECRGNASRAGEMYLEAVDLLESGLRKTLFLFSEKVIDESKLAQQVQPLFASFAELVKFLVAQRQMKDAAAIQHRAVSLYDDITAGQSNGLQAILSSVIEPHLLTIKELISTKTAG